MKKTFITVLIIATKLIAISLTLIFQFSVYSAIKGTEIRRVSTEHYDKSPGYTDYFFDGFSSAITTDLVLALWSLAITLILGLTLTFYPIKNSQNKTLLSHTYHRPKLLLYGLGRYIKKLLNITQIAALTIAILSQAIILTIIEDARTPENTSEHTNGHNEAAKEYQQGIGAAKELDYNMLIYLLKSTLILGGILIVMPKNRL